MNNAGKYCVISLRNDTVDTEARDSTIEGDDRAAVLQRQRRDRGIGGEVPTGADLGKQACEHRERCRGPGSTKITFG